MSNDLSTLRSVSMQVLHHTSQVKQGTTVWSLFPPSLQDLENQGASWTLLLLCLQNTSL
jgi:hypothetical protein